MKYIIIMTAKVGHGDNSFLHKDFVSRVHYAETEEEACWNYTEDYGWDTKHMLTEDFSKLTIPKRNEWLGRADYGNEEYYNLYQKGIK